jgi:hypothetical protein
LASDRDVAAARSYRQQVDREITTINRGLPDEPRVAPRYRPGREDLANSLWPAEPDIGAIEDAQRDIRQAWVDYYRASSIFERKRR